MIDRRTFLSLFAVPRMLALEAIAAPRLPDRKVILDPGVDADWFEFRTYRTAPRLDLFAKAGIVPIRRSGRTYIIPFRSLADRRRAWDALAADPDWRESARDAQLTEISIYRRLT